jgi:hypothetical protein
LSLPRHIQAWRSTLLKPAKVAANLGAESTDAFLRDDWHHHQSLTKVYGAITFILEHPAEVEAYLKDSESRFSTDQGAISHASGHDRPF